eukprot:gene12300-25861_t
MIKSNLIFFFIFSLDHIISHSEIVLIEKTEQTYSKIIPCLKKGKEILNTTDWHYPLDAEAHYQYLLTLTAQWRGVEPHVYSGYGGPWIENHFISHFIDKPLSYFGGLIPLFAQWNDVTMNDHALGRGASFEGLQYHLRKNVIYLAVTQHDDGLGKLHMKFPNILGLSSGGFGNVPLPLIKSEIEGARNFSLSEYKQDCGFYGNPWTHPLRRTLLTAMETHMKRVGLTYKFHSSHDWQKDMMATKFNLAPRGYGRTSFRITEIIQMVRIPVYLYGGIPWFPYEGTVMDYRHLAIVGYKGNLSLVADVIKTHVNNESYINLMLNRIRMARRHYTYDGVMKQIELLLQDPFGANGGYLRCAVVPDHFNNYGQHQPDTYLFASIGEIRFFYHLICSSPALSLS